MESSYTIKVPFPNALKKFIKCLSSLHRQATTAKAINPQVCIRHSHVIHITKLQLPRQSKHIRADASVVSSSYHQGYDEGEGPALSNPAARGDTPLVHPPRVYLLAQGACQSVDFFPKVCPTYLVIFTCLDLFLRELCFFK